MASEAARAKIEKRMVGIMILRVASEYIFMLMVEEQFYCIGKVCLGESKKRRGELARTTNVIRLHPAYLPQP